MVPQPVPDDEAGGRNGQQQLQDHLGDAYQELPLYAPAGTCVIYDISLYHSRVNAEVEDGKRNRRALQTYYSRGDVPALTNWVIVPKRLAESEDAATARFYSLQARATRPLAGVFSRPLLSVVFPCAVRGGVPGRVRGRGLRCVGAERGAAAGAAGRPPRVGAAKLRGYS